MKRILVSVSFFMLLSGCTAASYQASCEQEFSTFKDQMNCTETKIVSDGRPISPETKEYLMYARVLSDKIDSKEITENEARYKLAEKKRKLKPTVVHVHEQPVNQVQPVLLPAPSRYEPPKSTHCTTTKIGNTLHTNCN